MGIDVREDEIETGETTKEVQKMFGIEGNWTISNYRQLSNKIAEAVRSEERHIEDNLSLFDEISSNLGGLESRLNEKYKKDMPAMLSGMFKDINKIQQLLNGVIESKSLVQDTMQTQNENLIKLLEDAQSAGLLVPTLQSHILTVKSLTDYMKEVIALVQKSGDEGVKSLKNDIIDVIKSSKEPIKTYLDPINAAMDSIRNNIDDLAERINNLESAVENIAAKSDEKEEPEPEKKEEEFNIALELEKLVKSGVDDLYEAKQQLEEMSGQHISIGKIKKNSWSELIKHYSKRKQKQEEEDEEDEPEEDDGEDDLDLPEEPTSKKGKK